MLFYGGLMKNIKIGHRIIAVPERMTYVNNLLHELNCNDIKVMIDNEHNGCMWNAIRAWEDYISESEATHWCVMADDTDVVNNYLKLEEMCVKRFPDAIWTFYSNELSLKHKPNFTPYIKLSSLNIRGIAFLMPVHLIDGYIKLCKYMLQEYNYQRDDATCRIYALMNDIPVMTTIPNLVCSYEIKSSMSGHGITRNSDAWQGKEIDLMPFLSHDYEVRHITKKSARETHLHKDNPIDMMVSEKWDKLNLLRRL